MSLIPDLQKAIKNMLRESLSLKLIESYAGYTKRSTVELWLDDMFIDSVDIDTTEWR